jgi:uncharacterized protein
MTPADAPRDPPASEAQRRLDRLHAVYERIGRAQAASLEAIAGRGIPLACPEGCSSCCESFVPDVLPVESDYLADWILRVRPELTDALLLPSEAGSRSSSPPCPFHESGRAGGGCGVYPARPLVCRLFGFASVRGRDGVDRYSLCKMMPSRKGGRSWSGRELALELGSALPVMADFSAAAVAIAPHEAGGRALLTDALHASLARLSLSRRLSSLETNGDGDEPRAA